MPADGGGVLWAEISIGEFEGDVLCKPEWGDDAGDLRRGGANRVPYLGVADDFRAAAEACHPALHRALAAGPFCRGV